ncbi:leucine--tRNA ligase [Candidatus Woesebacteria bacterium]|nr:leucine--tRNA ligase [Candidatus Woesebacteria bacterium]
MAKYNHKLVENKWSKRWLRDKLYEPDIAKPRKKFYNLMMFPYPSAEGLHAGNMFAFTGSDVYGRTKRMQGYDVFEPIGLDGFGIHSENYAIKTGKSPQEHAITSERNYYRQLREIGNGFDWSHTLETYDPDYYQWTQWLFIQMFKAGLAYRKAAEVNFCPSCKTVLADEQVINGVCERCGTIVTRKKLEQWFFKITKYADRLLSNLDKINWSEKIKIAQRTWIGKKEGVSITYNITGTDLTIKCWTSRPDTNFGATFIVLSPNNPIIDRITTSENKKVVGEYIKDSLKKSKEDKTETRKKTGVFTGSFAINPLTKKQMPIYVADYVLGEVGTGAVVGVPGHDRRDFEFAAQFGLPIERVVVGADKDMSDIKSIEQVVERDGKVINSGFLDGLTTRAAIAKIISYVEKKGWGKRETHYHLRDWLISRQRYWGPPIPMIYCKACAEAGRSWVNSKHEARNNKQTQNSKNKNSKSFEFRNSDFGFPASMVGWWPVPESDLPVKLPEIKDYLPKGAGSGPLADHPEFYLTKCPECGQEARRETDVSDTFLDSSWYFLRYPSVNVNSKFQIPNPKQIQNSNKQNPKSLEFRVSGLEFPWDRKITRQWLPVDLYFGGAEHAVLHLMYARFVTMVLSDLGYLGFEEPFTRFFAHGLMIKDGAKMSKSRGNVVNPDEYINKYGADTLRLYLMFIGPMDSMMDFRDTGIEGMRRFVERVWSLFADHKDVVLEREEDAYEIMVKMHQIIKKVTSDMENFRYNTAISAIMEYVNALRAQIPNSKSQISNKSKIQNTKPKTSSLEWKQALINLAKLLAPFAPFMAEEIWRQILQQKGSIHISNWPKFDEKLTLERSITIIVQIDGKVRANLLLPDSQAKDKNAVVKLAKSEEKVANRLKGRSIRQEVFIPGKVVNFVTK